MDPKFAVVILFIICGGVVGALVGPRLMRWLDEMDEEKDSCRPLSEEEAILEGFKRYNARGDLHEEERNMSSQMYEAGWADAKDFYRRKE